MADSVHHDNMTPEGFDVDVTHVGVRLHWLYFDPVSPGILDRLGFGYDSTSGYNEAVGYRAGTTQVYRPQGVQNLLELPLHVQDTALFYPDRMNLSPQEALWKVEGLIENAEKYGGVLTINWHHRSLGPERLWDDFYAELLGNPEREKSVVRDGPAGHTVVPQAKGLVPGKNSRLKIFRSNGPRRGGPSIRG